MVKIFLNTLILFPYFALYSMEPQQCFNVQELFKKSPCAYFKSQENTYIACPTRYFSKNFIKRLEEKNKKDKDTITYSEGKVIINCPEYTTEILEIIPIILARKNQLKATHNRIVLPSKIEAYVQNYKSNAEAITLLIKALRFVDVGNEYFSSILNKTADTVEIEKENLFYPIEDFYREITAENLKSLSLAPVVTQPEDRMYYYTNILNEQLKPSSTDRRRNAFTMVLKYKSKDPTQSYIPIIDSKSWQDLEILCGPTNNPVCYFASAIDSTSTELGKAFLYSKLLQPTDNIATLKDQQEIISHLVNNEIFFSQIDDLLKELSSNSSYENNILSFWAPTDFFMDCFLKGTESRIPYFKNFAEWLNTNEIAVQILDEVHLLILNITQNKTKEIKRIAVSLKDLNDTVGNRVESIKEIIHFIFYCTSSFIERTISTFFCFSGCNSDSKSSSVNSKVSKLINTNIHALVLSNISTLIKSLSEPEILQSEIQIRLCLYKKLILLAKYISILKKAHTIISKNKEIQQLMPALASLNIISNFGHDQDNALIHFWRDFSSPTTFDNFIKSLHTNTFKTGETISTEDTSTFNFFSGRIIATYRLMHIHKDKFFDGIMALAQLDMYMSLARLYKKHQNMANTFCLPIYNDTKNGPSMEIEDCWNPIVSTEAIPNSLRLGITTNPKDIVITGENAAGKSTVMRAFFTAALMSQSLSIAPAKSITITPLSKMRAYLNISDNPTLGLSLFQVSTKLVKDVIQSVQQIHAQGKYSLTSYDELYNGTKPKSAEALVFATLKYFSSLPNNICIASTHFPCVENLKRITGDKFAYYKLGSRNDETTRYKLEPGIYTQSNGFELAQEADLPKEIILEAQAYYSTNCRDKTDS